MDVFVESSLKMNHNYCLRWSLQAYSKIANIFGFPCFNTLLKLIYPFHNEYCWYM